MDVQIAAPPRAGGSTRTAGLVCMFAGILGAASGVFLALVPPAVERGRYSYPLDATGHALIQAWFVVQHVGLVVGLVALWRSGAVGDGRVGRVGYLGALWGMVLLTVTEAVAIGAASMTAPTPLTGALAAGYGISTTLTGVGLVLAGIAVVRSGRWHGPLRWLPLAMGIWVFVPMFPALAISFVAARYAISAWMLMFAVLGWALEGPDRTRQVVTAG